MRSSATTVRPLGIAIPRVRARLQIPNSPYTSRFMSFLPANLDVGTTIGDYQIVSVLGRGGMGKVFKVRNLLSDRIEAMKVLLPGMDPSPELVERFLLGKSRWLRAWSIPASLRCERRFASTIRF
jgi:serine/threonine protein kinase